jgi:hypothetical protein
MDTKPTANSSKRKQNGYSSATLRAKRNRKRDEAEKRQFAYDQKSTATKLKELGPTGSTRQRARLEAILAKEQEAAKAKKQAKAAVKA